MDFPYKHSRVKQYLKEGRALRIETVINKPADLGVLARLEHLPELVDKARQVNDRLLMIERAGQGCAIGSALFERIHQPYVREGQRTGALRFGDQRAMALAGALCLVVHAVTGFTNKSLRGHVAGLLGRDYSSSQMSYDLRRLRLHGLIERQSGHQHLHPHARRASGSPSSTPSSRAACSARSSRPTNPRRRSSSVAPSAPSTTSSATTSRTRASEPQPETCHKIQRPGDQEDLAPSGVLAVMTGLMYLPDVMRELEGRRPYRWTLAVVHHQMMAVYSRKVAQLWKPVLVYGNGERINGDVIDATSGSTRHHEHGQNVSVFAQIIERLTKPGSLVVDPFAGSGTTLVAAQLTGRHSIGCDIVRENVSTARGRLH